MPRFTQAGSNRADSPQSSNARPRRRGESGIAVIEFALTAPLLFGLILGVFDMGIYSYSFISVENAARVAALRNSGGPESAADQSAACSMAIEELRGLPNIGGSFSSSCGSSPLSVTAALCDSTATCSNGGTSPDGASAATVTVTYTVPPTFQLPIVGPATIARTAQMKVRNF